MKIRLIAGLGNPGEKYEHTRHNIGFRVVDRLADKFSASFIMEQKFSALTSAFDEGDTRYILFKPQTFMNNSGDAVAKLLKFYKIEIADLLVVHDEIDLAFGTMKLHEPTGAAGHNGVDSILKTLGPGFLRLRVGIENRIEYRIPPTDAYVLQNFTDEEETHLSKKIIPAALAEIEEKFVRRS